ncbi:hypothetical protein OJ996_10005 [Luteolibacter sp. GHJ8]|uniref:FHA domain-containing protein n=1 Tax=Luteolibacter rhizosphaerae TaxID=2989719 RepID=A0ABT3G256_9BACT|nr:hypothetical protein [Luteolibacter rhizosphaerae]MCW1913909.1 hypothetical protein [Luteolibacter rhizosphaerae]
MFALAQFAARLCLPLVLAVDPFDARLPVPPTGAEFDRKLEESKQEAVRLYPALADPNSIFSRAVAEAEKQGRRSAPKDFDWPRYPLNVARSTALKLRIRSPHDPVFNEVVPTFTTRQGASYSQLTVKKIRRDGIEVVHAGGTAFIPISDLTDPQRDKYNTRWDTEMIQPGSIIPNVESAARKRDEEIHLHYRTRLDMHRTFSAKSKFDFERLFLEQSRDLSLTDVIATHRDRYIFRLYELAMVAEEAGNKEALERIDRELRAPLPAKTQVILADLEEKIKVRRASCDVLRTLLDGKRCELLKDGEVLLSGVRKDGKLDRGGLEILSPDHIRVTRNHNNMHSRWVFKVDVATGNTTFVPGAGINEGEGTMTFRIGG